MEFTRSELRGYDTIEQSHSGDELKIDEGNVRVWLIHPENRAYDGDYQIEIKVNGKKIWLGAFKTIAEAEAAVIAARNNLHGEFARHE